jgi:hypothetical protein
LAAFLGAQDIQLTDRPVGLSRRRLQYPHQPLGDRFDAAPLKEIDAVFNCAFDAIRPRLRAPFTKSNKRSNLAAGRSTGSSVAMMPGSSRLASGVFPESQHDLKADGAPGTPD